MLWGSFGGRGYHLYSVVLSPLIASLSETGCMAEFFPGAVYIGLGEMDKESGFIVKNLRYLPR